MSWVGGANGRYFSKQSSTSLGTRGWCKLNLFTQRWWAETRWEGFSCSAFSNAWIQHNSDRTVLFNCGSKEHYLHLTIPEATENELKFSLGIHSDFFSSYDTISSCFCMFATNWIKDFKSKAGLFDAYLIGLLSVTKFSQYVALQRPCLHVVCVQLKHMSQFNSHVFTIFSTMTGFILDQLYRFKFKYRRELFSELN